MSSETPNIPSLAHARKLRRRRAIKDSWPLLVWLALCLLTGYAYLQGVSFTRMNGRVFTYEQNVSATATARITKILVQPGDTVTAQQEVVLLEDQQLGYEIDMERQSLLTDQLDQDRRMLSEIWALRADLAEVQQEQEADLAELSELRKEHQSLLEQLKNRRITEDVVFAKNAEIAALQARADSYGPRITQLETFLTDAEALRGEISDNIQKLQDTTLRTLESEKTGMVLRSQQDGIVAVLHFQEGDTVREGEPIMEITASKHDVVLAFVPIENAGDIDVSRTLYVSPVSDRHTILEAKILSLAQKISGVPDRASPLPDRILRGRKLYLQVPPDNTLLPGEPVVVHLEKPREIPLLRWWR